MPAQGAVEELGTSSAFSIPPLLPRAISIATTSARTRVPQPLNFWASRLVVQSGTNCVGTWPAATHPLHCGQSARHSKFEQEGQ